MPPVVGALARTANLAWLMYQSLEDEFISILRLVLLPLLRPSVRTEAFQRKPNARSDISKVVIKIAPMQSEGPVRPETDTITQSVLEHELGRRTWQGSWRILAIPYTFLLRSSLRAVLQECPQPIGSYDCVHAQKVQWIPVIFVLLRRGLRAV